MEDVRSDVDVKAGALVTCEPSYPRLSRMAMSHGVPAVDYIRAGERPTAVVSYHRGPGERAATLAASYCTRRLGRAYAQGVWQILADADRRGVIRHGRPEAWAAGAVVALARADGVLGADGALTAQEVADELDVTLGTLVVIERELARTLNLARYARRLSGARGRTD